MPLRHEVTLDKEGKLAEISVWYDNQVLARWDRQFLDFSTRYSTMTYEKSIDDPFRQHFLAALEIYKQHLAAGK
jgi:hypothetical protein